ncbi:chemotaxis protein CheW [bacterium]|nr:chemotaxis protein CheW [bacterium]
MPSQVKQLRKRQIVTFFLGNELFGIDIASVQEIIQYQHLTRLPQAPDFLTGIIELRGAIVPIIDLRQRFTIVETRFARKRIVIINPAVASIGFVVDDVASLIEIEQLPKMETPDFMADQAETAYVDCMVKTLDRIVIVILPDKILTPNEIKHLTQFDLQAIQT